MPEVPTTDTEINEESQELQVEKGMTLEFLLPHGKKLRINELKTPISFAVAQDVEPILFLNQQGEGNGEGTEIIFLLQNLVKGELAGSDVSELEKKVREKIDKLMFSASGTSTEVVDLDLLRIEALDLGETFYGDSDFGF